MSREKCPAAALVRLAFARLFINACLTGMGTAEPLQSLRLDQGEVAVGCLIALFALAQALIALPAGRHCERHGLERPIGGGRLLDWRGRRALGRGFDGGCWRAADAGPQKTLNLH